MFESTVDEHLQDWTTFCQVYEGPIREAFRSLPYVPPDRVDDLTQDFFCKLLKQDFLKTVPTISGRFRDYLFGSIRNFARDDRRRRARSRQESGPPGIDPADPSPEGSPRDDDPDTLYALSLLHRTVQEMRHHCETSGKPEIWRVFDELILAEQIPGRTPKSRAALLEEFPGRDMQFLDNRLTTAKRIFRRLLPELIPVRLSDRGSAEERFGEWLEILRGSSLSRFGRLHLAYLVSSSHSPDSTAVPSLDLAVGEQSPTVETLPETLTDDELQILLSFRIELPFACYLGGNEALSKGRSSRSPVPGNTLGAASLLSVIQSAPPPRDFEQRAEEVRLFESLKTFAKQLLAHDDHALPPEIALMLYTLATALSPLRCNVRMGSLTDEQFARNFRWALHRPWLDRRLRPALVDALDWLQAHPE
jgi:DNA-directed RNA polymerase specialized sigma24 family protein